MDKQPAIEIDWERSGKIIKLRIHTLKTLPEYFQAVHDGRKPFEARVFDRDFKLSDFLALKEWDENSYTGRLELREITYLLTKPEYVKKGMVILGLGYVCCWVNPDFDENGDYEKRYELLKKVATNGK